MFKFIIFLTCTAAIPLFGEVYLSLPGKSKNVVQFPSPSGMQQTSPENWHNTLGLETLWEEDFFCNSRSYTLTGGTTSGRAENFLDALLLWYPQPVITVSNDGLLLKWQTTSGTEHRLWWRPPTGNFPGVWFHISLGPGEKEQIRWPEELPQPGGITPVRVLEYPSRGVTVLDYSAAGMTGPVQFRQWHTALCANGWESLSLEGNLPNAAGEMLIHHAKGMIMLLQAGDDGGSIYIKKQ